MSRKKVGYPIVPIGDFKIAPFVGCWQAWDGHHVVHKGTRRECEAWARAETARRRAAAASSEPGPEVTS